MILYRVSVIPDPAIETEWREWMQATHIPDVLRTGCFRGCRFQRMLEPGSGHATYVIAYECETQADYERYRAQFAPALQEDHSRRYAGRFRAARELLEEVAHFSADA